MIEKTKNGIDVPRVFLRVPLRDNEMMLMENTQIRGVVENMLMCLAKGLNISRQICPIEVLKCVY